MDRRTCEEPLLRGSGVRRSRIGIPSWSIRRKVPYNHLINRWYDNELLLFSQRINPENQSTDLLSILQLREKISIYVLSAGLLLKTVQLIQDEVKREDSDQISRVIQ